MIFKKGVQHNILQSAFLHLKGYFSNSAITPAQDPTMKALGKMA